MIAELYRDELRRLHEGVKAFAAAHPDAARWLSAPAADPDVERLLEGTAFLAARIRARTAAVDDDVAQGLCAALLPTAMRPMPALAMLRFAPARGLRDGERVPAGSVVESTAIDGESCRFRLAWDAQVPAASVAAVELHAGERPRLEIRLALPDGIVPARLGPVVRFHAAGEPVLARALVRALACCRSACALAESGHSVPLSTAWVGPGAAPLVLPGDPGLGMAHAILAEALAWPELSLFVDVHGPQGLGIAAGDRWLRLIIELERLPAELRGIAVDDLLLGCAPAVNLWPAEAEPVLVDAPLREAPLRVAGRSGAIAWSVERVRGGAPGRATRQWQHARSAVAGPCWQEIHGEVGPLLAVGGLDDAACDEVLSIDIMAHDGLRAARVGVGELRVPGVGIPGSLTVANLRPPTRVLLPPTGPDRVQRIAARLRLAATGLRDVDCLASLLDLHDRRHLADAAGRSSAPRIAAAIRGFAARHRAVPWGAAVARALVHAVDIDPEAAGGAAGAWLLGCPLERAIAALAPLGTVTVLEMRLDGDHIPLVWPPRCAGAEA